jgi:rhodanese-related sulfurtransferase
MTKSYRDLVEEARAAVTTTTPDGLQARREAGEQMLLIDVREPDEWGRGVIPGAERVPRGILESAVDAQVPRSTTVVLYCAAGNRSALAARSLKEMGFDKVESLDGGFSAWAGAGLEVER